jgi:Amt family ammonium transporter
MLSVLMQVFAIVCIVSLIWVIYGYSLAFTNGGGLNDYIGGFSKAFLPASTDDSMAATFSNGVVIPEFVYICFQMTFACITPALIVGAFAERMKFSALLLFTVLWVTFIYFPMAHMVWYWGGPDAIVGNAAKAAGAAAPAAARLRLRPRLTRSTPMPACSSNGALSTSPAAPSCTSMPASPASSAASSSASASATARS